MNLARVKWRDHQRLTRGPLAEYSQPTEGLDATPRAGNDSGGGQLGNVLKCKPGGPFDYIYVVVQEAVWNALAKRVGGDTLVNDARFAAIADRRKNQAQMWALLNEFAAGYTKRELMAILNELDVPVRAGDEHEGSGRGRARETARNVRRARSSAARQVASTSACRCPRRSSTSIANARCEFPSARPFAA